MKQIKICIAGLGNVGSALIESIEENNEYFKTKNSLDIKILGISAKSKTKSRKININNYGSFNTR